MKYINVTLILAIYIFHKGLYPQEEKMPTLEQTNRKNLNEAVLQLPEEARQKAQLALSQSRLFSDAGVTFTPSLYEKNHEYRNNLKQLGISIQYLYRIKLDYTVKDNAPIDYVYVLRRTGSNQVFIIKTVKDWNLFISSCNIQLRKREVWPYAKMVFSLLMSNPRRSSNRSIVEEQTPKIKKTKNGFALSFKVESGGYNPQANKFLSEVSEYSLNIRENGTVD